MKGDIYRFRNKDWTEINRRPCHGGNCKQKIAWAVDDVGRRHPFDPETGESHFTTCPDRDEFRKNTG